MGKVVVHVEHCKAWGYPGRYERLKAAILKAVPSAEVTDAVGRKSSFEITVNDKLIYSALESGKLPDEKEIVEKIKEIAAA